MTAAVMPTAAAEAPAAPLVEKALVRWHLAAAMFFMVTAMTWGFLVSLQFFGQYPFEGISWLSYGRVRLLHTNEIAFGFLVNGFVGCLYYAIPRMTGKSVASGKLGWFIFFVWQFIILAMSVGQLLGFGQGVEDKMARVEELAAAGGRVLFAGDGVNDAPALRAAHVGVAMACGTALARSQSGVEVLGGDLGALPRLLDASRALRATVRRNLFWSVAYNGVALAFATMGQLHPLLAAVAMIVSSLTVSARSYRLLSWEPAAPQKQP